MSSLFTINFRREAFQRELAKTRRRTILLGASLAYFGMLAVIFGLYGLNFASLTRRAEQIEKQTARMRAFQEEHRDWTVGMSELGTVEQFHANPGRWRDRLTRLASLLPPNAVLTSLAVNPDNIQNPNEVNKLVITGELRVPSGQDRMRAVVQLVTILHADSVFSAGYRNIGLASSRALEGGALAEFVIECR